MLRSTLSRSAGLLRSRALVLFGIAVAVYLPLDLVLAAIDDSRGWGDVSFERLIIWIVVFSLADVFAYAACIVSLGDETVGVIRAIGRAFRIAATLIALTLVILIGVGLGLLALIIPGIVLIVWWLVAYQTAVLEQAGWRHGLRRSRDLASGHFFSVLLVAVGLCGGYFLVELVLFSKLGNSVLPDFWSAWLMGGLTDVITLPVGAAVTTALYLELVKERSDLGGAS